MDTEGAALAEVTVDTDPTTMGESYMFDNSQSQSGSAFLATSCLINAVESLEKARVVFGGHTGSAISNRDDNLSFGGYRFYGNSGPVVAVLNGIMY